MSKRTRASGATKTAGAAALAAPPPIPDVESGMADSADVARGLPPGHWIALQLLWPMAGTIVVREVISFQITGRSPDPTELMFLFLPWLIWIAITPAVTAFAGHLATKLPRLRAAGLSVLGLLIVLTLHYAADAAIRDSVGGVIYYPHRSLTSGLAWMLSMDVVTNTLMYVATIAAVTAWAHASRVERQISAIELARCRLMDRATEEEKVALHPKWFVQALRKIEMEVASRPGESDEMVGWLSDEVRRCHSRASAARISRQEAVAALPEPPLAKSLSPTFLLLVYAGVLVAIVAWRAIVFGALDIMPFGSTARWLTAEAATWLSASLYAPLVISLTRAVHRAPTRRRLYLMMGFCVIPALCAWFTYLAVLYLMSGRGMSLLVFLPDGMIETTCLAQQYLIVAIGIASASYLLESQKRMRGAETERERLRSHFARHELRVLRTQLDPHFLCNALNSVLALLDEAPSSARMMIRRLRQFYQRAIGAKGCTHMSLEDELRLVRSYLSIESIRFAERLNVNLSVDPKTLRIPVPTLVLQPLFENAIRHGVARLARPSNIHFMASLSENHLVMQITNDVPAHSRASQNGGFGLQSTAARLRYVYGDRAEFDYGALSSQFVVRLTIPIAHAS